MPDWKKELLSTIVGLLAFAGILAIGQGFLLEAIIGGGTGYVGTRWFLPSPRVLGSIENYTDEEMLERASEISREFDTWIVGIIKTLGKSDPNVAMGLQKIRNIVQDSFDHLQKDSSGIRGFLVSMEYYLKTLRESYGKYEELRKARSQNETLQRGILSFEEGLDELAGAFDSIYTALVEHRVEELAALRKELAMVRTMDQIIPR